jgi:hypothetical protein
MQMTRRDLMAAGAVAGTAVAITGTADAAPAAVGSVAVDSAGISADLDRYLSFGVKRSGGPGDEATGVWLEGRLKALGYACDRQAIDVPCIEAETCDLTLADGVVVPLLAQAPWVATPAGGLSGLLFDPATGQGDLAVIRLSHARWSTTVGAEIQGALAAARSKGATGVILITTGPSGEALALNALPEAPGPGDPSVAILAPKDAAPVLAALAKGETGRLRLTGEIGRRPAWNLIGRLDRGEKDWLVVSTPRSGWFACGGERAPGVAVWLDLAAWAARGQHRLNIALLATSGHEFENHGGHQAIATAMPGPDQTALWLHLGANVAARDWHEAGGRLSPLPSADAQRYLLASDALLPAAREAFAGQPGLEAAYPLSRGAAGELGEIAKAGYPAAIGIFGAHRLHHARIDDARALHPPLVVQAAEGARRFLEQTLKRHLA